MARLFRSIAAAGLGLALVLAVSACARPLGDFGRAEHGVLHDDAMPALGGLRAGAMGEPVSTFNLMDQERDMRDRVWRYLTAPHAHDWFYDTVVELERTRILPSGKFKFEPNLYYLVLTSERYASSRVRYNRLGDDVEADVALLPSVFKSICTVQGIDRQRQVAGEGLDDLEPAMRIEAADREAENKMIIGWFTRSLGYRYGAYSYALDHLLVETPHEEAIAVDAGLSALASYLEAAERDDFCSSGLGDGAAESGAAIPSRYLVSAAGEGPFRK